MGVATSLEVALALGLPPETFRAALVLEPGQPAKLVAEMFLTDEHLRKLKAYTLSKGEDIETHH